MATTVPNLQRIEMTVSRYNTVLDKIAQAQAAFAAADAPGAKCFVMVEGAPSPVPVSVADAGAAISSVLGPLTIERDRLATALNTASTGLASV